VEFSNKGNNCLNRKNHEDSSEIVIKTVGVFQHVQKNTKS